MSDPFRTHIGPLLLWLPTYTYYVDPKFSNPLKHRSVLAEAGHPCWTLRNPCWTPTPTHYEVFDPNFGDPLSS